MKKEIIEEIKKLKEAIGQLKKENKELRQRVTRIESGNQKDLRLKAERFLGFTMSNVRGYYNAVRTVNGAQIRVYIGKNISEEIASKKIIKYLVDNVRWLKNDILTCEDLMQIEEISSAINSNQ